MSSRDEAAADGHNEETNSGRPERRRDRYVTWDEHIDLVKGALIAFFVVVAMSSVGIYWAWSNGQKLEDNGAAAVYRSCISRADLRVTVAVAIDQLRILALREPKTPAEEKAVAEFIERTQAPVDRLLSQAAGEPIRTEPPGALRTGVRQRVLELAAVRCEEQRDDFRVGFND